MTAIQNTAFLAGASVLGWTLVAGSAAARPIRPSLNLDSMVDEAELVFRGRVTDVSYRKAEPNADGAPGPPHTFVTYEIDEVFAGTAEGTSLTLRFFGGPVDESRFTTGSGFPLFDAGDEDVLLVKGNTESLCPLVSCADGRFRVIEGKMYNELGQRIEWTPEGSLARGRADDLEAVKEHRMSDTIQLTRHETELEREDPWGGSRSVDPHAHIEAEDFRDFVRHVAQQARSEGSKGSGEPVKSADISKPFTFELPAGPAPVDPVPEDQRIPRAAEEENAAVQRALAQREANRTASRPRRPLADARGPRPSSSGSRGAGDREEAASTRVHDSPRDIEPSVAGWVGGSLAIAALGCIVWLYRRMRLGGTP